MISRLINYYFNLAKDQDREEEIVAAINRNVHFRGANLWTLIFAIIIASVGLNVNSTAVIIGAMLISPLMGPIMGIGLGIGISDFALVKRGWKNLLIAVAFSIITSTIYFYITPLHRVTSELLSRTTPTIWDVFIAFAGGLAGIVGTTRREKGNVIPGVAIATALMPPLCTAGYGLATGNFYYFLGALYLFFINSVFICIATVLMVRFMKLHKKEFESEGMRKRVSRLILLVVVVTVAPSVWIAYRIVKKAVFESSAETFVSKEFAFPRTQVVDQKFLFDQKQPTIKLLLIGQPLDSLQIDSIQKKLPAYSLAGAKLVIRQGLDADQEIDFAQIKASILDEVFTGNDSLQLYRQQPPQPQPSDGLSDELPALFPQIAAFSANREVIIGIDSTRRRDTLMTLVVYANTPLRRDDQQRLERWVSARFAPDSTQVIFLPR